MISFYLFTLTLPPSTSSIMCCLYKQGLNWFFKVVDQHHPRNPRQRNLNPPTASPMQVIVWFLQLPHNALLERSTSCLIIRPIWGVPQSYGMTLSSCQWTKWVTNGDVVTGGCVSRDILNGGGWERRIFVFQAPQGFYIDMYMCMYVCMYVCRYGNCLRYLLNKLKGVICSRC